MAYVGLMGERAAQHVMNGTHCLCFLYVMPCPLVDKKKVAMGVLDSAVRYRERTSRLVVVGFEYHSTYPTVFIDDVFNRGGYGQQ